MSDLYCHYLSESVLCRCSFCAGLIHEGETYFIDDEAKVCKDCFWEYLSKTHSCEEVAGALELIIL